MTGLTVVQEHTGFLTVEQTDMQFHASLMDSESFWGWLTPGYASNGFLFTASLNEKPLYSQALQTRLQEGGKLIGARTCCSTIQSKHGVVRVSIDHDPGESIPLSMHQTVAISVYPAQSFTKFERAIETSFEEVAIHGFVYKSKDSKPNRALFHKPASHEAALAVNQCSFFTSLTLDTLECLTVHPGMARAEVAFEWFAENETIHGLGVASSGLRHPRETSVGVIGRSWYVPPASKKGAGDIRLRNYARPGTRLDPVPLKSLLISAGCQARGGGKKPEVQHGTEPA